MLPGEPHEERGRRRERRALTGAVALVGARGTALVLSLASVPLTLPHLGPERFGMWMTINSVVVLVSFADLGLGNGVMTLVAEDEGRDDRRAAAAHSSNAFFGLAGAALALGALFAAIQPITPWHDVYNVSSSQAVSEAGSATAIAMACFLVTLPLSVARNVQLGCQEGLRKGVWDAAGNVLSLAGIVLVVALDGSLPWLVAAFAGGPVVAALANSLDWFLRVRPELRPRLELLRRDVTTQLLRMGSVYMVLQLAAVVAFFSDALILAHVLGPESVTDYSVAWKLFSVVSLTLSVAMMPLWPAYSEAAARHDAAWVRATLWRSVKLTVGVALPASLLLLAVGSPAIDLWSDGGADPPLALLAALAAWTVIGALGNALAMLFNALRVIRLQLVVAVLMAAVNVPLSIALAHAVGVEGVVLGTLLSYTFVALVPLLVAVPRVLGALERRAADAVRAAPAAPLVPGLTPSES